MYCVRSQASWLSRNCERADSWEILKSQLARKRASWLLRKESASLACLRVSRELARSQLALDFSTVSLLTTKCTVWNHEWADSREITSELTREKFSRVNPLLNVQCEITIHQTIENFHLDLQAFGSIDTLLSGHEILKSLHGSDLAV